MQALIIVDMQQASIANSDKYDTQGVVARINTLAQRIRDQQGQVIFIAHDGNESEGLVPHSAGWQILDSLIQGRDDLILRKTANDAFYQTTLAATLTAKGIEDLIFCGWATDFCVDSSVKSALAKNYRVSVAKDCHTVSDRPYLSASQVIEYYNWLWQNMLPTRTAIEVRNSTQLALTS